MSDSSHQGKDGLADMTDVCARLIGWGNYLPDRVVTNQEILETCGTIDATSGKRVFNFYGVNGEVLKSKAITADDIVKTRGIERRRYAADDQSSDDLAIEAAGRALARAGLPADTAWRGIFVHCVHRRLHYPAIAQRIQHRFGLTVVNGYAEDCSSACAGYVQQVQKITDLMRVKPGAYLVVGADVMSRTTPPEDVNFDLFGDAAGATVWVPGETGQPGTVVATMSMAVTRGTNGDVDPIDFIYEDQNRHMLMPAGPLIVKWGRRNVFKVMEGLLERAGWRGGPPLVLIPHQANINLLKFFPGLLSRVYDGDVRLYSGITNIGNAGSASTAYGYAACLDETDDGTGDTIRIRPGDRVILVAFGAGMSIHGLAIQH